MLFANYVLVSLRHIKKNKQSTFICIAGLALAMAAILIIYQYAAFEFSYDKFHQHASQLYRVTTVWNGHDERATTVPWSGPGVKDAFPEVVNYTRVTKLSEMNGPKNMWSDNKPMAERDIVLADNGFLSLFSFKMIAGNPQTALKEASDVVITKSIADKYFAGRDPLNQILYVQVENLTEKNYRIAGIIEDPPANSHLKFHFILSHLTIPRGLDNGSTYWHWDYAYTYLQLQAGTDPVALGKKISRLRVSLFQNEFGSYNDDVQFRLQPLTSIHLSSHLKAELSINGDKSSVNMLLIVGCCILLAAYFNYVNLSSVRMIERTKEMRIRKIIGSRRTQLMNQLIVENVLINLMALIGAILLTTLFYTASAEWSPLLQKGYSVITIGGFIILSVIFVIGVVISCTYPLIFIKSFNPVDQKLTIAAGRTLSLRSTLTTVQFIFCFLLVTGTAILHRQLAFMKQFDLGMNIQRVVAVEGFGFQSYKAFEKFKALLNDSPDVAGVGYTTAAPGDEVMTLGLRPYLKIVDETDSAESKLIMIDEGYLNAIGIELQAGRNFDVGRRTDEDAVIINETAAKLLGYNNPQDIIGKSVAQILDSKPLTIIGVVRDFHQRSLRTKVEPVVLRAGWAADYGWNTRYFVVKLASSLTTSQDLERALTSISDAWTASSDQPLSYFFVDDRFEAQYQYEYQFALLYTIFSIVAITVSLLGLYGLMSYVTIQRRREIGIRKILGATITNVLILLCGKFARLSIIAVIIAVPSGWYLFELWLSSYAYRITMTPLMFALPLILVIGLTMLTVTLKSASAAMANPVDAIRAH